MSPEHFHRQAKVKMRIIAAREMRDWMAGRTDFLPGNTTERTTLDAIRQAYEVGLREGRSGDR